MRVAVDIPSGLAGDSGQVCGAAVRADYTYTLAWPKQGLFLGDAAEFIGQLRVLNIGIPVEVADQAEIQGQLLTPDMRVKSCCPATSTATKTASGTSASSPAASA